MPISLRYKLLFVHIPKTGGGSIEKAISAYGINNQGSNIHCSKILYGYRKPFPENEEEFNDNCPKRDGFYCCNRGLNGKIKRTLYSDSCEEKNAMQHLTISEIRGKKPFLNCFSFSFVRNPFDRIVSEFEWRNKNEKAQIQSFDSFIDNLSESKILEDRHLMPQHLFITNKKGKSQVDFIGRFENLNQDFQSLCERQKLSLELKQVHQSNREKYQTYFSSESKEKVEKLYAKDLELFNYEF